MAPKLWLALKPIHVFHMVVSREITGETSLSLASSAVSRGWSFLPLNVYEDG
jgi:hypothetical protein